MKVFFSLFNDRLCLSIYSCFLHSLSLFNFVLLNRSEQKDFLERISGGEELQMVKILRYFPSALLVEDHFK